MKPVYLRGQAYIEVEEYELAAADFKVAVERQKAFVAKMDPDDDKLRPE